MGLKTHFMKEKNIVAGLGEIGKPLLKLFSSKVLTIGYDINSQLSQEKKLIKFNENPTKFLHICIPFNKKFQKNVESLSLKFNPKGVIIHSTVSPYTTKNIQKALSIPVIYSATRGVHKRMISDLKKYTKFFAISKSAPNAKWANANFRNLMKKCNVKTKQMSDPITLELAKIVVDTSYYGWLINYAQISYMIAKKHGVDYDEMWSFSHEIHKFLGNRPKMFPGFIGGHCVIPNLNLINESDLDQIRKINSIYLDNVPEAKKLTKKYSKGKSSYDL